MQHILAQQEEKFRNVQNLSPEEKKRALDALQLQRRPEGCCSQCVGVMGLSHRQTPEPHGPLLFRAQPPPPRPVPEATVDHRGTTSTPKRSGQIPREVADRKPWRRTSDRPCFPCPRFHGAG